MKRPWSWHLAKSLALLALAGCAGAALAQCKLPIDQSPNLRGFKLGMSKDEAERSFGQRINRYTKNEANATAAMAVAAFEYPDKLNKIISIDLKFFEDRVYWIQISYGSGAFENLAQAQQVFAQEWKLPSAWTPVKYGDTLMYCNGWTVVMRLLGGKPQVELAVPGSDQKIQARAKQKAASGFKP
jgi:hypothetical protein